MTPGPGVTKEAPVPGLSRRRLHGWLKELHRTLRTEGDTPGRQAAAVAIGTFIGCTPIYGTHLVLCLGLARLFRLNRLLTYLAAHINNPLTAPWLLALSYGLGHRFVEGTWPPLSLRHLAEEGVLALGRDLLLGSVLVGLVLAPILGVATYAAALRRRREPAWSALVEATALRYASGSPFDWEFVRGKLRGDPAYRELLARLRSFSSGRLVDLGCGRGIALTLFDTARSSGEAGGPGPYELIGVERRGRIAEIAATALGTAARIEVADLASYTPPEADRVLLIDVLHYLEPGSQERLISAALRSLAPGGALLVREADASGGWSFFVTRAAERFAAVARGRFSQRFHYRSAREWRRLLSEEGCAVRSAPARAGTPFANVLIEASRSGVEAERGTTSALPTASEPPGSATSRSGAAPGARGAGPA